MAKPKTAELTSAQRKENKIECEELSGHFRALHTTFEETTSKQRNISEKMLECKQICDQNLRIAKSADGGFKATLAEETRNLEAIVQLDHEGKLLHELTCQQIKWCSDQVEYSRSQTDDRIKLIQTEIKRLQDLEKLEAHRRQNLVKCKAQIDKVKAEEDRRAEASASERARAKKNATERVQRAEKAVKSSEELVQRLSGLYKEVQLEFADAMAYGTEVLKAIGVDCHTAFFGHGKFLAIQREIANKNLIAFQQTREEKLRKKIELERLEDDDIPATMEKSREAGRELEKAQQDEELTNDKIKAISDGREQLLRDYQAVDTFLRRHASAAPNDKRKVMTMPMARRHLGVDLGRVDCCNVAEFRDQRDDATSIGHILEALEDFEVDFKRRYSGETDSNLGRMFTDMNKKWGLGRLLGQ